MYNCSQAGSERRLAILDATTGFVAVAIIACFCSSLLLLLLLLTSPQHTLFTPTRRVPPLQRNFIRPPPILVQLGLPPSLSSKTSMWRSVAWSNTRESSKPMSSKLLLPSTGLRYCPPSTKSTKAPFLSQAWRNTCSCALIQPR